MQSKNKNLQKTLNYYYNQRNSASEVTSDKPDPILIAKKYSDEYISLICALFSYGNVKSIVKFLSSLDYSFDEAINDKYYRFQNTKDVQQFFVSIIRLKNIDSIESIFYSGYKKEHNILDGLLKLITTLYSLNDYKSRGYRFLIGKMPTKKLIGESTYKRWNMYFRWMVRDDNIDLGLWKNIDKKDLIMPLDVHTFNISKKMGLLTRDRYDLYSSVLLTQKLKEFDIKDPVKYDFSLYRLGQERVSL
jgi:uncharacterized protein (TIGR02757 family)